MKSLTIIGLLTCSCILAADLDDRLADAIVVAHQSTPSPFVYVLEPDWTLRAYYLEVDDSLRELGDVTALQPGFNADIRQSGDHLVLTRERDHVYRAAIWAGTDPVAFVRV